MEKIRLLIVDDSALIRKMLTEIFSRSAEIDVVGTAPDPLIARDKIKRLNPDVLTLDIEMPRMDGLTFLRNLMRLRPMPVVMVSTLTEKGAEATLEALRLGAFDFAAKPKIDTAEDLSVYADEIIAKVKAAARASVEALEKQAVQHNSDRILDVQEKHSADVVLQPAPAQKHIKSREKLIALGASTGGTEAIKCVIAMLPETTPAIVVAQHLPAAFSASFARHVDLAARMSVAVARDGQAILPGNVYIAPGDRHLLVIKDGAGLICRLHDGPAVNRHKPAVDVMFRSVAQNVGANAISVLLTGMGADGAKGMQEMHESGACTIIQDEQSSVVWGMPGEAFKLGCTDYVVALENIANQIMKQIQQEK